MVSNIITNPVVFNIVLYAKNDFNDIISNIKQINEKNPKNNKIYNNVTTT